MLKNKMKTWKKAAIGSLITLVSLGYFIERAHEHSKKVKELVAITNQPKLKKYYELEYGVDFLNKQLDQKKMCARVLVDPNYFEKKERILQDYSDIYREYCETKNELEKLLEDRELENLKQTEKAKWREIYNTLPGQKYSNFH